MKRDATHQLPMDLALPTILSQPTVAFHLLPLSGATQASPPNKTANPKKRSRSPYRQPKKRTEGSQRQEPSIPAGLINKALETLQKQRLCWASNLPNGCSSCKPGETCAKGRAGVLQTPFASRPSMKREKFHPRLVITRTADQPRFCIRIIRSFFLGQRGQQPAGDP